MTHVDRLELFGECLRGTAEATFITAASKIGSIEAPSCRAIWASPYLKHTWGKLTTAEMTTQLANAEKIAEDTLFEGIQALRRLVQGGDVDGKQA